MLSRRRLPAIFLALLVFTVTAALTVQAQQSRAQQGKAADDKPIKVSVTEVILPVTVTDEKGRFVSNLVKEDFHIYDEGKEQKIDFFSHEQTQPIVIGFLVDMSNSMKIHWSKYQEAASELMLNLLPGDKRYAGYLITYANEPELVVNTSSDSEKMVEKLRKYKPSGGAALYDALYMACTSRTLVKGEPYEPRRVIIIIGDGHDTASKKSLQEVLEVAQRNLVTIYAMSTVSFGFHTDGEETLTKLTEDTGGKVEQPLNDVYKDVAGFLSKPSDEGNYALTVGTGGYTAELSKSIFRSVTNLSGEITTQYIIRYRPDIPIAAVNPKIYRKIRVGIGSDTGAGINKLQNVKVRYRLGYYPFAP